MGVTQCRLVNLIFIGPCIVLYSYSTTNKLHLLSQIIYSCRTLYMFRTVFPSIIRSSKLRIQQRYMSNSCCYLLPAAGNSSCLTYTFAVYAVFSSWWWTGIRVCSTGGENRRTRGKTCPSADLPTTNLTCTDLGSKPGLIGDRCSLTAGMTALQIDCQTFPIHIFNVRRNKCVNQKIPQHPVASGRHSWPAFKHQSQHVTHCVWQRTKVTLVSNEAKRYPCEMQKPNKLPCTQRCCNHEARTNIEKYKELYSL